MDRKYDKRILEFRLKQSNLKDPIKKSISHLFDQRFTRSSGCHIPCLIWALNRINTFGLPDHASKNVQKLRLNVSLLVELAR